MTERNVNYKIITEGDDLDFNSKIYQKEGTNGEEKLIGEYTWGFSDNVLFSNEELILISLIDKYRDTARFLLKSDLDQVYQEGLNAGSSLQSDVF